jgi:hypothetical protein
MTRGVNLRLGQGGAGDFEIFDPFGKPATAGKLRAGSSTVRQAHGGQAQEKGGANQGPACRRPLNGEWGCTHYLSLSAPLRSQLVGCAYLLPYGRSLLGVFFVGRRPRMWASARLSLGLDGQLALR